MLPGTLGQHSVEFTAFHLSVITVRSDSQNVQVHASVVNYRKCLHSKLQSVAHLQQISLSTTQRISLWNIELISTWWIFGKARGWCWCSGVDTRFSQWLSVACWIDAIARPEATTETTRLSTKISGLEIWWANLCFSYCTSHFSYQNSSCEDLPQFLYVLWYIEVPLVLSRCAYVSQPCQNTAWITYSLLISQSATWDETCT